MSVIPVIPLCPLVFWGIATLIDLGIDPWGTILVGALHVVFAIVLVISIWRDRLLIRSLTTQQGPSPDGSHAGP